MRINCEVHVHNRMLPSLNMAGKKKGTQSSLAIGKKPGAANDASQLFLQICTLQNKSGTKYKIHNNIKAVFAKFVEEGKFTIQLKEPTVDILIKAEPLLAKGFLKTLKLALTTDKLEKLPLSHLNAVKQRQIEKPKKKLAIKCRSDYPLTQGFPPTLEILLVNNINMKRIEERILKLKYLREINLSDNIIKTLPLELANLSSLSVLIVKGNQIEEIPEQLFNGKFKDSLVNLDLSNNNIRELPFSIGKLNKLEILNVNSNNLVKLPYSFGKLRKLQELRVANNEISYFPLSMLHNKLSYLDFNFDQNDTENVIADFATGRVPPLVELAAASCVKQGLNPQPWDIPYTLCEYIEKYKVCLCTKILFTTCVYGSIKAPVDRLARDHLSDRRRATLLGYFCSQKCLTQSLTRFLF